MKGVGMLVVSLRGVNFGFWSHLGCSGQKNIEIYIFNMYIFNSSYSSCAVFDNKALEKWAHVLNRATK